MRKNTTQEIKSRIKTELPAVFTYKKIMQFINKLQVDLGFSDSIKSNLNRHIFKVEAKWSLAPELDFRSLNKEPSILELLEGVCNSGAKYYLSHQSALYFNELIEQRPLNYYISRESKDRKKGEKDTYNPRLIKQSFMKSHRVTSKYFSYEGYKSYILEKQDLKNTGVIEKRVKDQDKYISIRMTDVERTLLDAVIAPQYSGGILTTINCFEKAEINLKYLFQLYSIYSPFYPYWQALGLILEKLKGSEVGYIWDSFFSDQKKEFYLDRKFRSSWLYSDKWQIHYPKGVFRDGY